MTGKRRAASEQKTKPQIENVYFESLFENVPEAIIMADNDGKVLQINKEFTRIFGYSPEEVIGKKLDRLVAPPHLTEEATQITQKVLAGKNFSLETLRRKKTGEMFHVSVIGAPIFSGGQQVASFGIYRDISDRKKAEEAFQLEKTYLAQLVETAAEGIVVMDQQGHANRVNSEFLRMFGYREEEVIGQPVDSLVIPPNLREEASNLTETAISGGRFAIETVRQRKDGTLVHVSIIGSPIVIGGQQVANYGIYRDISDRKRAEEAFQLEKSYLEQLVETAAEGIVVVDQQGRVNRANSEFLRMFGYREEEVIGQPIDDLVIPPSSREEAANLTGTAVGGGRFAVETVRRRKDGTLVHVSIIGSPIVVGGRQVANYGIYRDISDRKKAEADLLESRQLLMETNQSLHQRTRQLEEANSLLEQLSNLDGLTGIPNRRYFEHFFDIEWRRTRREKKWMSVIMVDVDYFKKFNDLHGHLAGDECLKKIAHSLQVVHRAGDLVARYGGEEFVVVLPNTDRSGAQHIADVLRARVQELNINHGSSLIDPFVTISLGVASQIPDKNSDQLSLLMKADSALYQAKIKGRNRVEYAT